MDPSVKFLLLVLLGVVGLTISQDLDIQHKDADDENNPGECPEEVLGPADLPLCAELCANKENCTTKNCVTDSQCEGSLKCCTTRCGTECLPPVFRHPCQGNFDCPRSLKCCNGSCDSDCVYQPKKLFNN